MSSGNKDQNPGAASASTSLKPPADQTLKCPRCDSSNTKFCYYNNYSLTQPRHFCKTCRRYWTKGGALRNVPIGGGCRKTKKSSSKSTSSSSSNKDYEYVSSSDLGNLQFLRHTISHPPAVEFQNPRIPYNHFPDVITTNYSLPSPPIGFIGAHTTLASSIESLSCINQDLHWKLQQQRYASISLSRNESSPSSGAPSRAIQVRSPQMTGLFQSLDAPRNQELGFYDDAVPTQNEWFFDTNTNSFALPATASATTAEGAMLNSDGNASGNNVLSSSWNAVHGWSEQHFG